MYQVHAVLATIPMGIFLGKVGQRGLTQFERLEGGRSHPLADRHR